jgi:hypothetical protein
MIKILSMRFLFYGMAILEFALYSCHEIVHHKALFAYTDYMASKARILLSGRSARFWDDGILSYASSMLGQD